MKGNVRSSLLHYAQGLLMGGSDIIPGVSGGTMALIVGIYRRLIDSISSLFSVVLGAVRLDGVALREHSREVEWRLIIPLILGIGTAIVVGAMVIPSLLERYPEQCRGLFFGLVAASLAIPWLRIEEQGRREVIVAAVAAVVVYMLVGLPQARGASPNLLRVFFSAAVAICAMILPGVSGAFLLEALGIYRPTLEAGHRALEFSGPDVLYVLVFMAGAALGLGVFSKVLNWLIKHYQNVTMAALVGMMAGALRALWPWQTADRTLQWPQAGDPVMSVAGLALFGFAFIAVLTWFSARRLEEGEPADKRSQQPN